MENNDILDPEIKDTSFNGEQSPLPNAVATLVLGIISIVGCLFWGIIGLICGVIALSLHGKDKRLYKSNPSRYSNSYKMANAGYICAIIGVSLSAIYFLLILFIFTAGTASMRGF